MEHVLNVTDEKELICTKECLGKNSIHLIRCKWRYISSRPVSGISLLLQATSLTYNLCMMDGSSRYAVWGAQCRRKDAHQVRACRVAADVGLADVRQAQLRRMDVAGHQRHARHRDLYPWTCLLWNMRAMLFTRACRRTENLALQDGNRYIEFRCLNSEIISYLVCLTAIRDRISSQQPSSSVGWRRLDKVFRPAKTKFKFSWKEKTISSLLSYGPVYWSNVLTRS